MPKNGVDDVLASPAAAPAASLALQTARRGRGPLLRCIRSCLYCPCDSINGVLDIVSDPNTRDFALAFIIGEAFGALISDFVESTVTPLLRSAFSSPDKWIVKFISGGLLLAKGGVYDDYDASAPNATEPNYASVLEATDDGALVLDYTTLINAVR